MVLATVDGNGDGVMGIPMAAGGPFAGFNISFNANLSPVPVSCLADLGSCDIDPPPIPVPGAIWLFGSGLAGLLGVARRRKAIADRG